MSNPKAFTLKKWFYELLNLNYAAHDQIIERIAVCLTTAKDMEDFGKLIGQVYDSAYRKAVEDCRTQIESTGLKLHIVDPPS